MKSLACLLITKRLSVRRSPNCGHSSTEDAIENISLAASGQNQPGHLLKIQGRPTFLLVTKQHTIGIGACLIFSASKAESKTCESVGFPSEIRRMVGSRPSF